MKKILALTVSALLLSSPVLFAKKLIAPDKQVAVELRLGDADYSQSYFYTAAEHFRDVVRQDSTNRAGNFGLAMSLYMSRDYVNAEIFFRQFYAPKPGEKANTKKWEEEDKKVFNKGDYYFGEVLHRNGEYDEAEQHLNKFIQNYTPKDTSDNLKKLAALEVAGCEFAKTGPKAKVKFYNAGAGVNKAYNEGAPFAISENEIYYSSIKGNSDSLIFVQGKKVKPVYEIKHSIYDGTLWSVGQPIAN